MQPTEPQGAPPPPSPTLSSWNVVGMLQQWFGCWRRGGKKDEKASLFLLYIVYDATAEQFVPHFLSFLPLPSFFFGMILDASKSKWISKGGGFESLVYTAQFGERALILQIFPVRQTLPLSQTNLFSTQISPSKIESIGHYAKGGNVKFSFLAFWEGGGHFAKCPLALEE